MAPLNLGGLCCGWPCQSRRNSAEYRQLLHEHDSINSSRDISRHRSYDPSPPNVSQPTRTSTSSSTTSVQSKVYALYTQKMSDFQPWIKSEDEVRLYHARVIRTISQYMETYGGASPAWKSNMLQIMEDLFTKSVLKQCPIQTRSPASRSPRKVPEKHLAHIGILLDEHSVTVGEMAPGNKLNGAPNVILCIPAKISFFKDRTVSESPTEREPLLAQQFTLLSLLKAKPATKHKIVLRDNRSVYLTGEKLLAAFFQQLLTQVRDLTQPRRLARVVVTTSNLLSSCTKERLKHALTMVLAETDVRIISSLLSTAIAYSRGRNPSILGGSSFFPIQNVMVIHCNEDSFSMGLVDITVNNVVSRAIISSLNILEAQNQDFTRIHSQMYNNFRGDLQEEEFLRRIYRTAFKSLSQDYQTAVVVIRLQNSVALDSVVAQVFGSAGKFVSHVSLEDGPLTGACLLAGGYYSDSQVGDQVYDSSISDLEFLDKNSRPLHKFVFKHKIFVPGKVGEFPVRIDDSGESELILNEMYPDQPVLVGKYLVCGQKSLEVVVTLDVDENGIFKVKSQGNSSVTRMDELLGLKDLFRIPGSSPPNEDTPNPEVLEALNRKLALAVEESVKLYRAKMIQVVDGHGALTESQIREYHQRIKTAILDGFLEFYENGLGPFPNRDCLLEAKENLDNKIQELLPTYVKRYQVREEAQVQQVRGWMLELEEGYRARMEKVFSDPNLTPQNLEKEHYILSNWAQNALEKKFEEIGLSVHNWACQELVCRLRDKFEDVTHVTLH